MSRGAQTRDLWFFIRAVFSGTMWCFAEAVREMVVAVTRSPETRQVVVLSSSVRVVPRVANFEHETQVRSHLC